MSVSAASSNRRQRTNDPIGLRLWFWSYTAAVVGVLVTHAGADLASSPRDFGYLALWAAGMALADYLEVQFWRGVHLSMSFTVGIAAAMVFAPITAAGIAFIGSLDPREVRGEVPLRRALYNRSQVAAAVGLGSLAFHQFNVSVTDWPLVLAPAAAAVVVDGVVNTFAVVVPICVFQNSSP